MVGTVVLGIIFFVCNPWRGSLIYSDQVVAASNPRMVSSGGSAAGTTFSPRLQQSCLKWHAVSSGENQWVIARRYGPKTDRLRWLRNMRLASGKRLDDTSLKIGESICVGWNKIV